MKTFGRLLLICFLFSLPHIIGASYVFKVVPARAYKKVEKLVPFDAIIVPGVPYYDTSWSRIMQGRVKWAVFLYKKGWAKNIIFSGAAVYTPYYESKIMALYAEQLGVPRTHMLCDTMAEHSTENVYYSYKLGLKNGMHKMAIATDPYQSLALRRFVHDRKLELSDIPLGNKMLDSVSFPTVSINPASAKATRDFVPLPERENFFRRIGGTLGLRIREDVYN